jgi:hypothetical protein
MARSLCGVPGLTNGGSAHSRAGSETTDVQRYKQPLPLPTSACEIKNVLGGGGVDKVQINELLVHVGPVP